MRAVEVTDRAATDAICHMDYSTDYNDLNDALKRCGSNWDGAQAHGLLCSRLAVSGPAAGAAWQRQVLEGIDDDTRQLECAALLETLAGRSHQQLAERLSEFVLLLPDDSEPVHTRAEALAHWCEGFLHGLVSGESDERLRKRLAADPLADVIKDLLQITRATADVDDDTETNDAAYVELVEFVRVAVQLTYEELAAFRPAAGQDGEEPSRLH